MTTCPFCNRDPFCYVDVGVGSVPVGVDCCELGDAYFRGARPLIEHDVVMPPDEFMAIGDRIQNLKHELDAYRAKFGEIFADEPV